MPNTKRTPMVKNTILTLLGCLSIYLMLSLFVYFISDPLIYFKMHPGYRDNENVIKLKTNDGATISAIYLKNPASKYTILVSHGNAEDIGYMWCFLKQMQHNGFAVFAYDYHGYGTSTGKPSEKNCYADIDAAYTYLTQEKHVSPTKIILYGRSLGAAVALDLAVRQKAAALIMQSPFVSAYRVVTHIPLFPYDKFNSLSKISKLNMPLLIIHGTNDYIIPIWHGIKLYQNAPNPKRYLWIPGAGHNDIPMRHIVDEKYWQEITYFVKTMLP